MSDCSMVTNFAKKNAIPFIMGVTLGFLGHYAVKWLKDSCTPVSTFPLVTIHIIQLTENGSETRIVSCSEFKTTVTTQQLNALRIRVKWASRTEEKWQKVLDRSANIVCVKKDNQLVGYGSFIGNGIKCQIVDMHVDPDYQGKKIGTLMMNHLINQIISQNYLNINLFGWEENESVLKFYEKFGFVKNPYGMESSNTQLKNYSKV